MYSTYLAWGAKKYLRIEMNLHSYGINYFDIIIVIIIKLGGWHMSCYIKKLKLMNS